MILIFSFILPTYFHHTHREDGNKLFLPVKLCIWEFINARVNLGKNWGLVGFFRDLSWGLNLFPLRVSGKFWWTHKMSSSLVSVDALRPHVSAGTWSRFAALRPEQGVSCFQLPPCYLSSPSVPVPLSLFGFEEKWHLLKQTVIAASCPYVGLNSPVIHFKSTERLLLFFPVIRD